MVEKTSRVSEGSEFQSRGPMTEKALLPSDDLTYGMEQLNQKIVCYVRLLICKCFVCEKTDFVIDSLFERKPV